MCRAGSNALLGPWARAGAAHNDKATNITAQGILSVSAGGLLRIQGNEVNLARGGLEVRPITGNSFQFITETNFYPDVAITDLYWALTNGTMLSSTLLSLIVVVFIPIFAYVAVRFRDQVFPASWNDQRLSGAVAGVVLLRAWNLPRRRPGLHRQRLDRDRASP